MEESIDEEVSDVKLQERGGDKRNFDIERAEILPSIVGIAVDALATVLLDLLLPRPFIISCGFFRLIEKQHQADK